MWNAVQWVSKHLVEPEKLIKSCPLSEFVLLLSALTSSTNARETWQLSMPVPYDAVMGFRLRAVPSFLHTLSVWLFSYKLICWSRTVWISCVLHEFSSNLFFLFKSWPVYILSYQPPVTHSDQVLSWFLTLTDSWSVFLTGPRLFSSPSKAFLRHSPQFFPVDFLWVFCCSLKPFFLLKNVPNSWFGYT